MLLKMSPQISDIFVEVQFFKKIVGLKDRDSASPVLENSPFLFNLVLDADIVIIIDHHFHLAHAVVVSHLQVQFRITIHHAALLHQVLERAHVVHQRHPKGTYRKHRERARRYLCFCRSHFLLVFYHTTIFDQGHRVQGFSRSYLGCRSFQVLVVFFRRRSGKHMRLEVFFRFLLAFDFAFDEMQDLWVSTEEEGMAEDVLAGVLATLVEAVHVELTDEGVDVAVPKVLGKDMVLKVVYLLDGKLASVGHPVDDGLVFFVFQDLEALLDEVSDGIVRIITRHVLLFLNFYSLNKSSSSIQVPSPLPPSRSTSNNPTSTTPLPFNSAPSPPLHQKLAIELVAQTNKIYNKRSVKPLLGYFWFHASIYVSSGDFNTLCDSRAIFLKLYDLNFIAQCPITAIKVQNERKDSRRASKVFNLQEGTMISSGAFQNYAESKEVKKYEWEECKRSKFAFTEIWIVLDDSLSHEGKIGCRKFKSSINKDSGTCDVACKIG